MTDLDRVLAMTGNTPQPIVLGLDIAWRVRRYEAVLAHLLNLAEQAKRDYPHPDGGAYHLHRETLRLVRREGGADA